MEYTQLTLDDWLNMKNSLKQDILNAQDKLVGVRRDFVRIGYKLRKIEEMKLYEQDGYRSIAEFAKAECDMTGTDVTRFMQINKRYSVGGYSEELQEEFLKFGSSKLAEMLTLPDKDMEMITPEATRGSIRELKSFNKTQPVTGVADDIRELIQRFYEDDPDLFCEVIEETDLEKRKEMVNPSGNRCYKKGLYFLMMYEDSIKIKKYGGSPLTMTWEEFFGITDEIYGDMEENDETGHDTRTDEAGETDAGNRNDTGETECVSDAEETGSQERRVESTDRNEEIPGEKEEKIHPEKIPEETEENEVPQIEESQEIAHEKDNCASAIHSGNTESNGQNEPEKIKVEETKNEPSEVLEKSFGTRKDYMDSLTAYGMALYLANEHKEHRLDAIVLRYPDELESWLMQEVDCNGYTWEG